MKAGGGKRKGSKFEREICGALSLWWSKQAHDDYFWRTASSGGRSTARSKKGKTTANSCGDICATDPEGAPFLKVFAIEVKSGYNKFSIQDILDAPPKAAKQVYEEWIEQAKESSRQSGSLSWLVIFRRDRREALAMLPSSVFYRLLGASMRPARLSLCDSTLLVKLSDFLKLISPESVSKLSQGGE